MTKLVAEGINILQVKSQFSRHLKKVDVVIAVVWQQLEKKWCDYININWCFAVYVSRKSAMILREKDNKISLHD